VVEFYDHLHALIEGDEEAQTALHGELPEVAPRRLGDIGLAEAQQDGALNLFEAAPFTILSILKTRPRFPQHPVTSNLAPHFKFVHHCPSRGSTAQ
jgi:hypothetical protein